MAHLVDFYYKGDLLEAVREALKRLEGSYALGIIRENEPDRVAITACGTAWHTGVIGKYAFEHLTRIPVDVDIASEYRYRNNPRDIFLIIASLGRPPIPWRPCGWPRISTPWKGSPPTPRRFWKTGKYSTFCLPPVQQEQNLLHGPPL